MNSNDTAMRKMFPSTFKHDPQCYNLDTGARLVQNGLHSTGLSDITKGKFWTNWVLNCVLEWYCDAKNVSFSLHARPPVLHRLDPGAWLVRNDLHSTGLSDITKGKFWTNWVLNCVLEWYCDAKNVSFSLHARPPVLQVRSGCLTCAEWFAFYRAVRHN